MGALGRAICTMHLISDRQAKQEGIKGTKAKESYCQIYLLWSYRIQMYNCTYEEVTGSQEIKKKYMIYFLSSYSNLFFRMKGKMGPVYRASYILECQHVYHNNLDQQMSLMFCRSTILITVPPDWANLKLNRVPY